MVLHRVFRARGLSLPLAYIKHQRARTTSKDPRTMRGCKGHLTTPNAHVVQVFVIRQSSGSGEAWESQLSKHQLRGWRAVPVAGLQDNGCNKRSVVFPDTGITFETPPSVANGATPSTSKDHNSLSRAEACRWCTADPHRQEEPTQSRLSGREMSGHSPWSAGNSPLENTILLWSDCPTL